jgi:hypothetical protein
LAIPNLEESFIHYERKILHDISTSPVRLEPGEGCTQGMTPLAEQ